MRKLLVPILIAMLAAFAPPERGLRYVFEIGDPALQAKTAEVMRKRAEIAGLDAVVLPVDSNRVEVRVPYGTEHAKLVRMMTWPGVMSFNLVDPESVRRGVDLLAHDLSEGAWDARNGHLRGLDELDLGYVVLVAGATGSAGPSHV